jgi:transcriptional regulator with GAF, ATPase, and Fis domain
MHRLDNIIGKSHAMRDVFTAIKAAAASDVTVLVYGDSGTGKELVAGAIHYNSERAAGPLITVNCSALSESLLESELFGHVKGAYTGALHDRAGRFEEAEGGTVFLDEIGELSPYIQVKLLRVLQEREIERVGESKRRKINKEELLEILNESDWNKAEAARRIGISRTAVWKYMKKWVIPLSKAD